MTKNSLFVRRLDGSRTAVVSRELNISIKINFCQTLFSILGELKITKAFFLAAFFFFHLTGQLIGE